MATVYGIYTSISQNDTPMVKDKARYALVTINAMNGVFYYHHITTSRIAGAMQTSGVYKQGSWLHKITGDIVSMHADVLGYVNGDSPDTRRIEFLSIPGAVIHPQSKMVR